MRKDVPVKAIPFLAVGLFVGAAVCVTNVTSSRPGDLAYGTKEAVVQLRTALAPDGREKGERYLDEADMTLAELTLLAQSGAPRETVAETAERAVIVERHAQAERSRGEAPKTTRRYEQHRQALQRTLRTTRQPVVRHSVRQMLRIVSAKPRSPGIRKHLGL